ncbi:MAG TPA: type II toxin-antitoxin system prevent-host-death family antitoxin [Phenylobacterium sp.]|jgi:prevent-host-death family protein|uniref:type II toxin-antitoxin system Phd/YefM family antitoxin n=1 Tax=Phenylobacterium sp. TaxID=1871053 RepID=UPI002D540326|nr:type II toxin-antitoxin system prevent-host-death family antitoxin [Phenylobacterium sp.]HZZ66748.1 type II toxin-antitoxin system prevent-host-death family antitoxin [Phenylobacterium sp.]
MTDIPLADAKARLSELVARAAAGDPVRITRRGRPVAELTAIHQDRKPLDVAALKRLTDAMPMAAESAGDLVRQMRDEDRF